MPFPGRLAHKAKIPDGGGFEHAPGIPVPGVPVTVHRGAALGAIPIDFPAPKMGRVGGLVTGGGGGMKPVSSLKKALGIPRFTGWFGPKTLNTKYPGSVARVRRSRSFTKKIACAFDEIGD